MALNPLFRGIFRVRGNVFCAHRITKCEREKGFEGVEMAVAPSTQVMNSFSSGQMALLM